MHKWAPFAGQWQEIGSSPRSAPNYNFLLAPFLVTLSPTKETYTLSLANWIIFFIERATAKNLNLWSHPIDSWKNNSCQKIERRWLSWRGWQGWRGWRGWHEGEEMLLLQYKKEQGKIGLLSRWMLKGWVEQLTGCFFTGSALKVLSMELVPPNKEIVHPCIVTY